MSFITNYLILILSKFLVVFVMLLHFNLTEPNFNPEPEKLSSWATSQVIKAISFLTFILEKYWFLDMLFFMNIFCLIQVIVSLSLLNGSIFHLYNLLPLSLLILPHLLQSLMMRTTDHHLHLYTYLTLQIHFLLHISILPLTFLQKFINHQESPQEIKLHQFTYKIMFVIIYMFPLILSPIIYLIKIYLTLILILSCLYTLTLNPKLMMRQAYMTARIKLCKLNYHLLRQLVLGRLLIYHITSNP